MARSRRRVLGSRIVYHTDTMMAVLVSAGWRHWDNRWLYLRLVKNTIYATGTLSFLSLVPLALSNPTDGNVVGGEATITAPSTNLLQIDQHTRVVIIDWRSFNIASGETTRFVQPDTSSTAVNRIGGNDPSQILGSLLANGRIVLINGNGILFGPNSRIDVGALLSTTSDADNADLMSGKATFNRPGSANGRIVNQGTINAASGLVGLIAPAVRNDGIVRARLGQVAMGASNIFTLDFTGDGLISFPVDANIVSAAIDSNGKPVEALVINNGHIEGSTVLLTARAARDLVANVVSMGGTIAATNARQDGGNVVLDAGQGTASVSGAITATGTHGGEIAVTGREVALTGAALDTSGRLSGGRIAVGGWFTERTSADAHTTLIASATTIGNAGSIAVIGGITHFAGSAYANGGAQGGNGGTIETSGHSLDIDAARVDTSASLGTAGTWLLDPDDYNIDAPAAATIATNLATGNVTIMTSAAGSGGNGDIFVNSTVSWSSANSLTLSAYRNIAVNQGLANSGGAAVILHADNSGTGTGTVSIAGSVVTSGAVSIFFNPSVNPAGSIVNATSYVSPTENYSGAVNGGGVLTSYMLVNSVYDLQNMQNNLSGIYALGRDIDASPTAAWNAGAGFAPVGSFSGIFDGQSHTISGLTINRPSADTIALFSSVGSSGTVRRVGLVGGSIAGRNYVGGLVGDNHGTITQSYTTGTVSGSWYVGGLAGQNLNGTITQSYATGSVNGSGYYVGGLVGIEEGSITQSYATGAVSGYYLVGGLVGQNSAPSSILTQSYATGAVSGTFYVGGLAGGNYGSLTQSYAMGSVNGGTYTGGLAGISNGPISQSYATGTISGSGQYVGGLVGQNFGSITSSYATGTVTSPDYYVGGLVGENFGGASITNAYATGAVTGGGDIIGGLVGKNDSTITNAYATGSVNGRGAVGGLVGMNYFGASIARAYATGAVSSTADNVGGLVGANFGPISQSYATGAVSGPSGAGGLTGQNNSTITQSYWDTQTTGKGNAVGSGSASGTTGLTSAQARTQSSYVGWDFSTDWFMIDGQTRPFLRSEYSTTISNAHQVQLMSMNTSASYTLANNIDFAGQFTADANGFYPGMWGAGGFYPIGTYTGTFDGQSHTISGLTINRPSTDNVALFGTVGVGGTVRNVGLVGGSVIGHNNVGGLAGDNFGTITQSYATGSVSGTDYAGGLVGRTFGTITQAYATGAVSGTFRVGGLIGYADGTVTQVYATGPVTGSVEVGGLVGRTQSVMSQAYATGAVSGSDYVGGLAGANINTISQSYATGTVSGAQFVGGLVGKNESGTISQSYATGAVGGSSYVGGLVGINYTTISQSYATGVVSGSFYVGGLAGYNFATISQVYASGAVSGTFYVGGLVGYNPGTITQSYATGAASGNTSVGGLVGDNGGTLTQSYATGAASGSFNSGGLVGFNGGTIGQSYWDTQSSGQSSGVGTGSSSGTTGLTTAQFQNTSGFLSLAGAAGWNFQTTWSPPSAGFYPQLYSLTPVVWVQANDTSRTYGAANPAFSVAGTFGGPSLYVFGPSVDSLSLSPTLSTSATSASNVGAYAITGSPVSTNSAGGVTYRLVYSGTLTINPASLTVTPNAVSTVYSGVALNNTSYSDDTANYSITGFQNGQNAGSAGVTLSGSMAFNGSTATSVLNVATYTQAIGTLTLASANDNYVMSFSNPTPNNYVITPATLTYTADAASRTYGASNPAFTGTVTGFVGTDNLANATTGSASFTSPATVMSNVDSYAINGTGLSANNGNYSFVQDAGNATALTINPATLTVAPNAVSTVYSGVALNNTNYSDDTANYTITGFQNGQNAGSAGVTLSGSMAFNGSTATSVLNVATYTQAIGTLTLASANDNYVMSFSNPTPNNYVITPATLTVIANTQSKVYGDVDPAPTYSASGFKASDTVALITGALSRAAGENVGSYAIGENTLSAGGNYFIAYTSANLAITPAALTVTANNASRVYDDPNPALTAAITGFKFSDTASVVSGLVLSTPATLSSNVGSYAISSSGGTATNYIITTRNNGTLTITPAPLSLRANDASRNFGQPNPQFSVTVTGLKLGDASTVLTGVTTTTTAMLDSPAGAYPIVTAGGTALNYIIVARTNGTLTVSIIGTPGLDDSLRLDDHDSDAGAGDNGVSNPDNGEVPATIDDIENLDPNSQLPLLCAIADSQLICSQQVAAN